MSDCASNEGPRDVFGVNTAGEARDKIGWALGTNQRLVCDRLHRRERVLDAMRKLVGQNALHFLGPLAVGDVAADLRCADHLSRSVAQRRHGQRYVNAAAILGNAHGLVVIDAFAALQPREDLPLLAMQFGRDDPQDRLADHLARLVPEDARRARVPRGDAAIEGFADDGVVRRNDDGRQSRRFEFGVVLLGDVHQQVDGANEPPRGVAQRRRIGQKPHARAVGPLGDGLDAAHLPALLEGDRHRALATGQRPAVRPIQAPRAAPLTASDFGMVAPQLGCGAVVEDNAAMGVGRVDRTGSASSSSVLVIITGSFTNFGQPRSDPPNECRSPNPIFPPHKRGELNARAASAQARPASPYRTPDKNVASKIRFRGKRPRREPLNTKYDVRCNRPELCPAASR